MTHVSLFSGIGGIDLAAEWAGFTTIAQVEKDPYCQRVLAKHWPDVHRVGDIRDFPDRDYGAITLVSGGVPCQPASSAGKRKGKEDDRWLWPETFRVIRELHPRWCILENVSGLLSLESGVVFEDLLLELEGQGYTVWPLLVPASGVGAPHLRYRVFIVAKSISSGAGSESRAPGGINRPSVLRQGNGTAGTGGVDSASADVADSNGKRWRLSGEQEPARKQGTPGNLADRGGEDAADTSGEGLPIPQRKTLPGQRRREERGTATQRDRRGAQPRLGDLANGFSTWLVEPNIPRVAKGVKNRVNKLRALGNAVVPQQVYPILQAIAEIEMGERQS